MMGGIGIGLFVGDQSFVLICFYLFFSSLKKELY
jgi:hypothetical protein